MKEQKHILVAPLNWGLGHATRCMPIIQHLLDRGCTVVLASDGRSYDLLQKEYPNLLIHRLPSYGITYSSKHMIWNMAWQMPKIAWAMLQERRWLKQLLRKEKVDAIITDNRYGLWTKAMPCIFLTHQLHIKIPWKWLETLVNFNNRRLIARFWACWIPDFEGEANLSGDLSHGRKFPANVRYIGPLSRMKPLDKKRAYELLVILSGPEPQRTYLEKKLISQLGKLSLKSLLIQGKTEGKANIINKGNLQIISYMTAKQLSEAMGQSRLIIARSGYSTIMDIVKLNHRAILIPTPGQTEQEYLADLFHEKKYFYKQAQSSLNLEESMQKMDDFQGFPLPYSSELLEKEVSKLLFAISPINKNKQQ